MNIAGVTTEDLKSSLVKVYVNYGKSTDESSSLKVRIWNAIKHIFGQSDWQVAIKKLSAIILVEGDKNSHNFSKIVFPGLREDTFSPSEAEEIANHFLNCLIKKSHRPFPSAILAARKNLDRCAAEVFFKKATKNPAMFPKLNLKADRFLHASSRKVQLDMIFEACRGPVGFEKLTPLLYDVVD